MQFLSKMYKYLCEGKQMSSSVFRKNVQCFSWWRKGLFLPHNCMRSHHMINSTNRELLLCFNYAAYCNHPQLESPYIWFGQFQFVPLVPTQLLIIHSQECPSLHNKLLATIYVKQKKMYSVPKYRRSESLVIQFGTIDYWFVYFKRYAVLLMPTSS